VREGALVITWEESGSGPPLVLVHGITEDRRAWDTVVPELTDHFRCVRLDLRNHGGSSDAADGSAQAMTEDVAEVVAAAGIDEPPVVVGHSLGGIVVTLYAAQAPVRAVVNVDQSVRLADFAALLQPLGPMLRGPEFADVVAATFAALGADGLPPEVTRYLEGMHASARQQAVLGVWDQVLDSTPEELAATVEPVLARITAPYLAIHGADPGPGYAEWLEALAPTAEVEVWDIGGHYPHLADPQRFARRVIDFVDQAVRGASSG
jgi:pimeloyl-ACP methyl ester carboxylesterase